MLAPSSPSPCHGQHANSDAQEPTATRRHVIPKPGCTTTAALHTTNSIKPAAVAAVIHRDRLLFGRADPVAVWSTALNVTEPGFDREIDAQLGLFEAAIGAKFFPGRRDDEHGYSVALLTTRCGSWLMLAAKIDERSFANAVWPPPTRPHSHDRDCRTRCEFVRRHTYTKVRVGGNDPRTIRHKYSVRIPAASDEDPAFDFWLTPGFRELQTSTCIGTHDDTARCRQELCPGALSRRLRTVLQKLQDSGVDLTQAIVQFNQPKWMRAYRFHLKCAIAPAEYFDKLVPDAFPAGIRVAVLAGRQNPIYQQRYDQMNFRHTAQRLFQAHHAQAVNPAP